MKIRKYVFVALNIFITAVAYGQLDSLDNLKNYAWKLDPYDLSLQFQEVDTTLDSFQNYNPLLRNTISANYLGNLGTPAQSKIYYDRTKYNTNFIFSQPYSIYFHLYEDQKYYNTKRQFTVLKYSNAGPRNESEQLLGVLHTQNVSKDFNFGFNYDLISSEGRYQNQQVRENLITLFSSYEKKGYLLHTNYSLNRVKSQENGGIDSLLFLEEDEYENRRNVPVRLTDAKNEVLNTSFYLAHEYRFGKTIEEVTIISTESKRSEDTTNFTASDTTEIYNDIVKESQTDTIKTLKLSGFSISHQLIYNSDVRRFSDDGIREDSFYLDKEIFIDSLRTRDEVRQKQFGNKVSLNFKFYDKFSSSISFYNEQMNYKYNNRKDTSYSYEERIENSTVTFDTITHVNDADTSTYASNSNVSFYLRAKLFNKILFKGYAEYYISGYKKQNFKMDGKFAYMLWENTEISLEGDYSNSRPDFFYENYTSNHFSWSNTNVRRIEELNAGFAVRNKDYKLEAIIKYGQIINYLYLDTTAFVNQYNGQLNILSGELFKRSKLGSFHFVTRFVYQQSTNDSILNIPELNLYQSLYYERLSKFDATGGKLLWQFGFDYRYSSSYFADGYMPTTGLFYRQFDHKIKDYHCLDLFINFNLRRSRFYIKYNYLNSRLTDDYYFSGPYYPTPEPVLKFGLAWTFYD